MADVLISSELLVDDVQIDSSLNSSSIDIDADIGSTTIIHTEGVSSVQGATGDVVLDIAYDEQSSVGLAEVGTAITSEPNYTPTGSIEQTLESVEFMTGATATLTAYSSNATLYLGLSFAQTKTTKTIPTSAAVFNGNGVNLIIKEKQ